MQILGFLGMYFDAASVFVTNSSLLFRLAMAILWVTIFHRFIRHRGRCLCFLNTELSIKLIQKTAFTAWNTAISFDEDFSIFQRTHVGIQNRNLLLFLSTFYVWHAKDVKWWSFWLWFAINVNKNFWECWPREGNDKNSKLMLSQRG